jgi:hypothetical protein
MIRNSNNVGDLAKNSLPNDGCCDLNEGLHWAKSVEKLDVWIKAPEGAEYFPKN